MEGVNASDYEEKPEDWLAIDLNLISKVDQHHGELMRSITSHSKQFPPHPSSITDGRDPRAKAMDSSRLRQRLFHGAMQW